MHLVAFITLLRGSLLGMVKKTKQSCLMLNSNGGFGSFIISLLSS